MLPVSAGLKFMSDKQQILERILTMFMRYGIRSMTMDDIARELGVSKKTLYKDFQDKKDLISQVIDFDLARNKHSLEQVRQPGIKAIEEMYLLSCRLHQIRSRYSATFYYDLKKYFPDIYQNWLDTKRSTIFSLISQNLERGKEEGVYRSELKHKIIGKLYVAKMEMLESSDHIDVHESLSNDFIKEIFFYHLHSICNQSGLIELAQWNAHIRNKCF